MIQNSLIETMIGWKCLPGVFISNRKMGKEIWMAERQREYARGRALRKEVDSVGNKTVC